MAFDTLWGELRDRCEEIEPGTVLVAPTTEQAFTVEATGADRIVIEYVDDGEERTLRRTQFEVLYDRLEADPDGIALSDLPAGVEPYVSILSLSSRYTVDGTLHRTDDGTGGESALLRPEWTARTRPERVRDDSMLLSDLLGRYDADLESLSAEALVDLYVLLSDVHRGADRLRREVGDRLLEYIGPDARLHGRFGTVHRTVRERRRLEDEDVIFDALDQEGIPHDWVLGVDPEKLDVVLAVTDLREGDVYDVEEQVYVQKTSVEEGEKQSRLRGLKDQLTGLDTEEAEELRDDIEELEERLDAVLAAG